MAYYSIDEIKALWDTAVRTKAEMSYYVARLAIADVQLAANGVGPDSFPSIVRQVLSVLLPYADVATMGHDCEFQYVPNASKAAWEGANLRFYRNCLLRIKDLYGWYDPRRYINRKRAAADYALLGGDISWQAWLAAKRRYKPA
jgi:hypothetical protein